MTEKKLMPEPFSWNEQSDDYKDGFINGFNSGITSDAMVNKWLVAHEMRVLFCALITAHKRRDDSAFFATVKIAKSHLSKYANFDDEDWALFRCDTPRKDASS